MDNVNFEFLDFHNKLLPMRIGYDVINKDVPAKSFWHQSIEILCIASGNGTILNGINVINPEVGDLVIINPNSVHAMSSNDSMEYYCVIIDIEFCKKNGIDVEKIDYMPWIASDKARELFLEIYKQKEYNDEFKDARVICAVLNFLIFVSKNFVRKKNFHREKSSFDNENVWIAIGYIKAHIAERFSLEEIAKNAGLSKYYFLREFKKITGTTITVFINILRCDNAKKMIMENKYSLSEIAAKCGFENYSYFSRTFKKYIGISPSEFIKENKNNI